MILATVRTAARSGPQDAHLPAQRSESRCSGTRQSETARPHQGPGGRPRYPQRQEGHQQVIVISLRLMIGKFTVLCVFLRYNILSEKVPESRLPWVVASKPYGGRADSEGPRTAPTPSGEYDTRCDTCEYNIFPAGSAEGSNSETLRSQPLSGERA